MIQYITEVAALNIVVAPSVGDKPPTINLQAQNITVGQVLSLVVRMANLQWKLTDGVVYISPKPAKTPTPKPKPRTPRLSGPPVGGGGRFDRGGGGGGGGGGRPAGP